MKADIYFTAVGMIDIPAEKEILATMEEMRNNPQDFKFVA
jgi:site-specific DNA recombinase